jgi:Arc/MetJ-type ribon-helix-helix transcriptional regulator
MRKHLRAVSSKPENQVSEQIDPREELIFRMGKDMPKATASVRLPEQLLCMIDDYVHDPRFPWKNRNEFLASAVFRLLEDTQKIEAHPQFDDSLKKLRVISSILLGEETGQRMQNMAQKLVDNVQMALTEGDVQEAKRMLGDIKAVAETMPNRRWREKLLRTVRVFGALAEAD